MPLTDPARELAATIELVVAGQNDALVSDSIAKAAEVQVWSREFFQIIFEILKRFDFVSNEISKLPLDEDVKDQALKSVRTMRSVFASKTLMNHKIQQVNNTLSATNTTILKMLSAQVRENVSYEVLSSEDRENLVNDVSELILWLQNIQSEDKDFIREALIEGLSNFLFRLDRLEWFGSGYTIQSLKEVIGAYLALQGIAATDDGNELITAMMMKTKALVLRAFELLKVAKDVSDTAGWGLKAYGAISLIGDGSATISGLLGGVGS
jgi:hypothetical protein